MRNKLKQALLGDWTVSLLIALAITLSPNTAPNDRVWLIGSMILIMFLNFITNKANHYQELYFDLKTKVELGWFKDGPIS